MCNGRARRNWGEEKGLVHKRAARRRAAEKGATKPHAQGVHFAPLQCARTAYVSVKAICNGSRGPVARNDGGAAVAQRKNGQKGGCGPEHHACRPLRHVVPNARSSKVAKEGARGKGRAARDCCAMEGDALFFSGDHDTRERCGRGGEGTGREKRARPLFRRRPSPCWRRNKSRWATRLSWERHFLKKGGC